MKKSDQGGKTINFKSLIPSLNNERAIHKRPDVKVFELKVKMIKELL